MTYEKLVFVKPEDIQAVVFRCKNCKAAVTIPIDRLGNVEALTTKNCAHCNKETGFAFMTAESETFFKFNEALAGLRSALQGRNLEYSFQISCDD
jgi:hypothetical protein